MFDFSWSYIIESSNTRIQIPFITKVRNSAFFHDLLSVNLIDFYRLVVIHHLGEQTDQFHAIFKENHAL